MKIKWHICIVTLIFILFNQFPILSDRWQKQRSRLNVQEEVVNDELHSQTDDEEIPQMMTSQRPPKGPPKNRKVKVVADKYVTMYQNKPEIMKTRRYHQDKPELTDDDMRTIRKAVATVRTRPNSAKPSLFNVGVQDNKENMYEKSYRTSNNRTPQPPHGGDKPRSVNQRVNQCYSVLKGASTGYNGSERATPERHTLGPPLPPAQRIAWQQENKNVYNMQPGQEAYRYGEHVYEQERDNLMPSQTGQGEQPSPYTYSDNINRDGFTSGTCTPNAYKNQNGTLNSLYNNRFNKNKCIPTYPTRPIHNNHHVNSAVQYNRDVDQYSKDPNHCLNLDNELRSHTMRTPQSPYHQQTPHDEDLIHGGSNQNRNVTFAEKLDSSRWIKPNRYTPQPHSQASYYENHQDTGIVRVAVDCEPDTEVIVRVTPGNNEGRDNKSLLYKRTNPHNMGYNYKHNTISQRLPWR